MFVKTSQRPGSFLSVQIDMMRLKVGQTDSGIASDGNDMTPNQMLSGFAGEGEESLPAFDQIVCIYRCRLSAIERGVVSFDAIALWLPGRLANSADLP